MRSWDELVAFAGALPQVEMASYYGHPVPKLNGKPLVALGHEPGSFVAFVSLPDKELLIETDPDAFWESDHYRGWPAVLVRYATLDPERVALLIERRWWDVAKSAQRKARGLTGRP